MKILIDRKKFAQALAEVVPFAPQKSSLLILKNALIVTKGGRLKVEANDTQCSMRKYIDVIETDQDGQFLVEIGTLSKYISKIKDEQIELVVENNTLVVKHRKGQSEFQTTPAEEYPAMKMPDDDASEVIIPSAVLVDAVKSARDFCGKDDLRPQMKPIYAYIENGHFGYCATDTRVLINDETPVEGEYPDINWYIEQSAFNAIANTGKDVETVHIKITPQSVMYRIGDTVIQTLQTKGKYPNFKRVIPNSSDIECGVDGKDLVDTISRVGMFCADSRCIKIDVSRMDITVSAEDFTLLRKSSETLQHNGCNGEITIGFHADYLSTCIGVCKSDEICLRMTDSSRPMLIQDTDKPSRTVLIMPMNINH